MKNWSLLCGLCGLLSFSPLLGNSDTLITLSPLVNYGSIFEPAVFPGGLDSLSAFLSSTMILSPWQREEASEIKVTISFAVGSDGRVFDILVDEGMFPDCEEEVVRVIQSLPRWHPAHYGEIPICMRMRLAIAYGSEK